MCPKCCWKSEGVAQQSSVKMRFCKTSQISQESIYDGVLFQAWTNCAPEGDRAPSGAQKDAFELWKLFFQEHLILDVKTTFRLQRPHCENFCWKHIKNESCKYYLGNKEQKAMFLVVSLSYVHFGFDQPSKIAHPKNRVPGKKFVQPCFFVKL